MNRIYMKINITYFFNNRRLIIFPLLFPCGSELMTNMNYISHSSENMI